MPTGIDHIVIAVRDLDLAMADYTAAGFTVAPGGEHTNGTTHNALIPFADGSYFELIAWKRPDEPLGTTWWHRFQAGEGVIDFALRTDDLDAEVDRLRAAGMNVPEPQAGGRTRPDGQRVGWRNLQFGEGSAPSLPFYCHSTNDRSLRVPGGAAAVHANDVTGIVGVTIGVSNLPQASRDFARVMGKADEAGRFEIGSAGSGSVWIALVDRSTDNHTRADLPIEITLATNRGHAGEIDPGLTHGARLIVEGPSSAGVHRTVV